MTCAFLTLATIVGVALELWLRAEEAGLIGRPREKPAAPGGSSKS